MTSTHPSLLAQLDDIAPRIRAASRIDLFLDFDGTISPIVQKPADAEIDPEIRRILKGLAARSSFALTVVSGRALADVRDRVGLPEIMYVGNHGLEIQAGEVQFLHPEAKCLAQELKSLRLQLQLMLGDIEGVEIEDKTVTLSVHFRRVPEAMHNWIISKATDAIARSKSFVPREGKLVVEVRPQVDWHKGRAVDWICREVLRGCQLPIYIGDDVTDEDAFDAVARGVSVRVGQHCETKAQYLLPDVPAVAQFLHWLAEIRPNGQSPTTQRPRSGSALVQRRGDL